MGDRKGSLPSVKFNMGGVRIAPDPAPAQGSSNSQQLPSVGSGALPVLPVNVRQRDADQPSVSFPDQISSIAAGSNITPNAPSEQSPGPAKRFQRPLRIEVSPPPSESNSPANTALQGAGANLSNTSNSINSSSSNNLQVRRQLDALAPIDTANGPQAMGTTLRRVSSTPGGCYSTSLPKRERPKVPRGVLHIDVPPEVSAKIQEILGDTADAGELLHHTIFANDPSLSRSIRRSTTSSMSIESPMHASTPSGALSSCWESVFTSRTYQKVFAIKESLARVYVLTTAKHLVSSLLQVKQDLGLVHALHRNEQDIKQLTGMLRKHMENLTVFISASSGNKDSLSDMDRGFLGSTPVPAYVCKLSSELPFLSQCFVELSRSALNFLAACDDVVRGILLDSAASGRYFFSQSLLRRDLEAILSYFNMQEVYLEYFGNLSRETFVAGCLPYTPLSKPELYSLISVGTSRYKTSATRSSGACSPSQSILAASSDQDMFDTIIDVLFADDPFRCSPFMVTFASKDPDSRPQYDTLSTTTNTFPQIYLSLSRQLYYSRMTKEGLDEFLKKHFELSSDYLACADLPSLMDMAMGLAGTDINNVFTGKRMFGEYTTNLYADMMVAKFVSSFYHDCLRKMQTQPTDGGHLAFSQKFSDTNRAINLQGLEQILQLPNTLDFKSNTGDLSVKAQPPATTGMPQAVKSSLMQNFGGTLEFIAAKDGESQLYILAVTERLMGGLKLANQTMERSQISACEMVQAMLVWYIFWAQNSMSRCAASSKHIDEVKFHSTFESLRRICALCADLTTVARFCDEIIERIKPDEGFLPMQTMRTPTGNARSANNSSQIFFGTQTLGGSGLGGPACARGGGLTCTTPTSSSKRAVTPTSTRRSHTPRNASFMLGPKRMQHTESFASPTPQQGDLTDITGYDVIVCHLSSISDDLKLLSAQCLEHAIELATKIASHICKDHMAKKYHDKGKPFFPSGHRSSVQSNTTGTKSSSRPSSPNNTDAVDSVVSGDNGTQIEIELPTSPRPWAVELEQQLFKPLSDFCRSDMFSSENILPRLLESCLHAVLERIGADYQTKMTISDARGLHTDLMYLKDWMEKEQRTQFPRCQLSQLAVFDRMHVIVSLLELPPDLNSWSKVDMASLYLLPDAPRWVKVRADRGKVPFSTVRRSSSRDSQVSVVAPAAMRLSLNVNNQSLEEILKLLAAEENMDSPGGRKPSAAAHPSLPS